MTKRRTTLRRRLATFCILTLAIGGFGTSAGAGGNASVFPDGSATWIGQLDANFNLDNFMFCEDFSGLMVCGILTATQNLSCTTSDPTLIENILFLIDRNHIVRVNEDPASTCTSVFSTTYSF